MVIKPCRSIHQLELTTSQKDHTLTVDNIKHIIKYIIKLYTEKITKRNTNKFQYKSR